MSAPNEPRGAEALVRRFEDLPARVQIAILLPVAVGVLFVLHITLLNQPFWRGLGYGVFWGLLATGAVMVAVRTERAKRTKASARRGPS